MTLHRPTKTRFFHWITFVLFFTTAGIYLSGCSKGGSDTGTGNGNNGGSTAPPVTLPALVAPTMIVFENADSLSTNQPGDFDVTISGPGANLVQMVSGETTFKAKNGILPISLVGGTVPGPSNPVSFTVSANIAGFTPFSQHIIITGNTPSLYIIKAFDFITSPPGTAIISGTVPISSNGGISGNLVSATNNSYSFIDSVDFSHPNTPLILDANGTPITTATSAIVKGLVVGSGSMLLYDTFEGGLYNPSVLDYSSTLIPGGVNFVPAATIYLNITANGIPVKSFTKPISVVAELDPSFHNLEKDRYIQSGDGLTFFSFNDVTQQMTYDGGAFCYHDNRNKLSVTMLITHPTFCTVGWYWSPTPLAGAKYQACGQPLTVNLSTDDPSFQGGHFSVYLEGPLNNGMEVARGGDLHNGSSVTFNNLPNLLLSKAVVYYNGRQIFISPDFNACSTGTLNLTIPTATIKAANPVNIAFNITGSCTNKTGSPALSAPFELYQQVGGVYQPVGTVNVINGKANTTLNSGSSYYLATVYNNTYFKTGVFIAGQNAFTVSNNTAGFAVTTGYSSGTNTVSFNGVMPVGCN